MFLIESIETSKMTVSSKPLTLSRFKRRALHFPNVMFLFGTRKVRRLNRLRFSCRNLHLYVIPTLGIYTLNSAYFTSKITMTILCRRVWTSEWIFCIVIFASRPNYIGLGLVS